MPQQSDNQGFDFLGLLQSIIPGILGAINPVFGAIAQGGSQFLDRANLLEQSQQEQDRIANEIAPILEQLSAQTNPQALLAAAGIPGLSFAGTNFFGPGPAPSPAVNPDTGQAGAAIPTNANDIFGGTSVNSNGLFPGVQALLDNHLSGGTLHALGTEAGAPGSSGDNRFALESLMAGNSLQDALNDPNSVLSQALGSFSADQNTFRQNQLNPDDFAFDPSVGDFAAGIPGRIGSAVSRANTAFNANPADFSALDADLAGLTDRAAARFPDTQAFERQRLGQLGESATAATAGIRPLILSQFGGDLEQAGHALDQSSFQTNNQFARAAEGVKLGAEDLRRQEATFLGGLEGQIGGIRSGLAQAGAADVRQRDLASGQAELQGGIAGQQLGLQGASEQDRLKQANLALQANAASNRDATNLSAAAQDLQAAGLGSDIARFDTFNQQQNLGRVLQAILGFGGLQSGLVGQGASNQIAADTGLASLLAGNTPMFVPISGISGGILNSLAQLLAINSSQPDEPNAWNVGLKLGPVSGSYSF